MAYGNQRPRLFDKPSKGYPPGTSTEVVNGSEEALAEPVPSDWEQNPVTGKYEPPVEQEVQLTPVKMKQSARTPKFKVRRGYYNVDDHLRNLLRRMGDEIGDPELHGVQVKISLEYTGPSKLQPISSNGVGGAFIQKRGTTRIFSDFEIGYADLTVEAQEKDWLESQKLTQHMEEELKSKQHA